MARVRFAWRVCLMFLVGKIERLGKACGPIGARLGGARRVGCVSALVSGENSALRRRSARSRRCGRRRGFSGLLENFGFGAPRAFKIGAIEGSK